MKTSEKPMEIIHKEIRFGVLNKWQMFHHSMQWAFPGHCAWVLVEIKDICQSEYDSDHVTPKIKSVPLTLSSIEDLINST